MEIFWNIESTKRTLGIGDKQILYIRAKRKCKACGKVLDFDEMQVGHKTAASKGGRATLRNCVCICFRCNKLQGTDNWMTFLKKIGKAEVSDSKDLLKNLNMEKLKFLAKNHNIKVKGRVEEGIFRNHQKSPSKMQYVNALYKIISTNDIKSELKQMPEKKKKKRKSSNL